MEMKPVDKVSFADGVQWLVVFERLLGAKIHREAGQIKDVAEGLLEDLRSAVKVRSDGPGLAGPCTVDGTTRGRFSSLFFG